MRYHGTSIRIAVKNRKPSANEIAGNWKLMGFWWESTMSSYFGKQFGIFL